MGELSGHAVETLQPSCPGAPVPAVLLPGGSRHLTQELGCSAVRVRRRARHPGVRRAGRTGEWAGELRVVAAGICRQVVGGRDPTTIWNYLCFLGRRRVRILEGPPFTLQNVSGSLSEPLSPRCRSRPQHFDERCVCKPRVPARRNDRGLGAGMCLPCAYRFMIFFLPAPSSDSPNAGSGSRSLNGGRTRRKTL